MLGGIFWNLFTWWFGLPSSSSHALIGGLCGAAIATASEIGRIWSFLKWQQLGRLWPKVVLPMISSPIAGFLLGGYLVMMVLFVIAPQTDAVGRQSIVRKAADL